MYSVLANVFCHTYQNNLPMTPQDIDEITTRFSRALPKPTYSLDVSRPEDEAKYVQDLQGHNDTVQKLKKSIDIAIGESIFLFSGQPGSGKTTELLRLKKLLQKPAERKIYYIDLAQWLSLEDMITLPNLLLSVLAAWMTDLGLQDSQQAGAITRLFEFLNNTHLELEKITTPKELGSLQYTLKNNPSFRALLDQKLKGRVNEFVQAVHNEIRSIKQQICGDDQELVMIIDSLEKIHGTQANRAQVYESLENIFNNDVYALRFPECKMVYSVSPALLESNAQLLSNLGMGVIVRMPSVHVFLEHSKNLDETSVGRMLDLIDKQFAPWRTVFTEPQMRELVSMSGGDLRDFYRAIRIALTEDTSTLPMPDSAIAYTKNQLRPPKDYLPIEHIVWLKKVESNHETNLSKDKGITASVLQNYLISKHILLYMNGGSWYAVHPLLCDWLAQQTTAA